MSCIISNWHLGFFERIQHFLISVQVFIGKIPKDVFEDEIIPLVEECGKVWDLRLMMDPMTGFSRGYAFCTFIDKASAKACVEKVSAHWEND